MSFPPAGDPLASSKCATYTYLSTTAALCRCTCVWLTQIRSVNGAVWRSSPPPESRDAALVSSPFTHHFRTQPINPLSNSLSCTVHFHTTSINATILKPTHGGTPCLMLKGFNRETQRMHQFNFHASSPPAINQRRWM